MGLWPQQSGEMPRGGQASGRHAKDGHAELFREEDISRSWTVARRVVCILVADVQGSFANATLPSFRAAPIVEWCALNSRVA